jgi:hypothetical protein
MNRPNQSPKRLDIGVNENTLHTWASKYSRAVDNTKAMRTDDHLYEELKRLKKEVAQLTEERNLLLVPLCPVGTVGKKGGRVPFGFAQDRLCQATTVDCRDAGGKAPTVGALGDAAPKGCKGQLPRSTRGSKARVPNFP